MGGVNRGRKRVEDVRGFLTARSPAGVRMTAKPPEFSTHFPAAKQPGHPFGPCAASGGKPIRAKSASRPVLR